MTFEFLPDAWMQLSSVTVVSGLSYSFFASNRICKNRLFLNSRSFIQ